MEALSPPRLHQRPRWPQALLPKALLIWATAVGVHFQRTTALTRNDATTAPASGVARVTLMGKQVRETQAGFQRHRVYSISTRRPTRDHRFLNLLGIRAVE